MKGSFTKGTLAHSLEKRTRTFPAKPFRRNILIQFKPDRRLDDEIIGYSEILMTNGLPRSSSPHKTHTSTVVRKRSRSSWLNACRIGDSDKPDRKSPIAMNFGIPPEKFKLLGRGNDECDSIAIEEENHVLVMTASGITYTVFKYFAIGLICLLGFPILIMAAQRRPISLNDVLFLLTLVIAIWILITITDFYAMLKLSRITPLLMIDDFAIIKRRGQPIDLNCESIELYLVHAFNSPHGEVIEVQLHARRSDTRPSLILSVWPRFAQDIRKALRRIGQSKGISCFEVKTDGPLGARPLAIKSVEIISDACQGD